MANTYEEIRDKALGEYNRASAQLVQGGTRKSDPAYEQGMQAHLDAYNAATLPAWKAKMKAEGADPINWK
jgi:hypothetical protein